MVVNKEYTFDNFCLMDSNNEAYKKIFNIGKKAFIQLTGPSGSGKKHLLKALKNRYTDDSLYITISDLRNRFIREVEDIDNKYINEIKKMEEDLNSIQGTGNSSIKELTDLIITKKGEHKKSVKAAKEAYNKSLECDYLLIPNFNLFGDMSENFKLHFISYLIDRQVKGKTTVLTWNGSFANTTTESINTPEFVSKYEKIKIELPKLDERIKLFELFKENYSIEITDKLLNRLNNCINRDNGIVQEAMLRLNIFLTRRGTTVVDSTLLEEFLEFYYSG